jgi:hypothetical protein
LREAKSEAGSIKERELTLDIDGDVVKGMRQEPVQVPPYI